jgi:hypothetical protein
MSTIRKGGGPNREAFLIAARALELAAEDEVEAAKAVLNAAATIAVDFPINTLPYEQRNEAHLSEMLRQLARMVALQGELPKAIEVGKANAAAAEAWHRERPR